MNPGKWVEWNAIPDPIDLPEHLRKELNQIVARFERSWEVSPRPDIAQFLPADDPLRLAVLRELVRVDRECRRKTGDEANTADYLAHFPDLAADQRLAQTLIAVEQQLGRAASGAQSVPDSQATLPPGDFRNSTAGGRPGTPLPEDHSPPGVERPVLASPAFDNRYEILAEIGRGGMGVVYRVHDRRRNQIVALKTLQWIDPGTLYRFKQEFRILADVAHPNLITLYELFSDGQMWCFTMEFVEGDDFLTHVTSGADVQFTGAEQGANAARAAAPARTPKDVSGTPLTADGVQRLRQALQQLVGAISYLHNAGKLHRDVKPQNILVTRQNRLVLLDFGLMAEMEREGLHESTVRNVVGTCAYMSPEQAAALPVSSASDWYSVGVMLFQALTGRLPFEGAAHVVLRDKQVREPVPPREWAPWVPDDLNDLCVDLLRRPPADRPSGEEILRRLGHKLDEKKGTQNTAALASLEGRLIGRGPHLRALQDALQSVTRGRPVVVYVQGRSGSGKSALVQSFLEDLSQAGPAVVLRGKCYEQESMPYKALDSLVDSLCRHLGRLPSVEVKALLPRDIAPLARVFPILRRVDAIGRMQRAIDIPDPHELRRRAVAGLRELLARIGDQQPLVLVIDDLQWGDADSAAVLTDLLRPPDPPVLLLVTCFRSEDLERGPLKLALEQFQEQIMGAADVRTVGVEPLSAEESRELATALLTEADAGLVDDASAVARESAGNPFFLRELVRHVSKPGDAAPRNAGDRVLALDEILFHRVSSLHRDARRLLEAIAVAGRPLAQLEAFEAAELDSDQAGALALLRSEHLLRTTGSGDSTLLETYHDRVREAIAVRLPQHRLVHYHRRLADILERSAVADPEEVAVHFQAAGDTVKASRYFALGAEKADAALAFQRAVRLYRSALALQPASGRDSNSLLIQFGDALAKTGHGVEAAKAYLDATTAVGAADASDLRRKAAMQLLISGHVDDGTSLLRNVLASSRIWYPGSPVAAIAALLGNRLRLNLRGMRFRSRGEDELDATVLRRIDTCWAGVAGLSLVDTTRAAYLQSKHILLALKAGEPGRVVRALALQIGHMAAAGEGSQLRIDKLLSFGDALAGKVGDSYSPAFMTFARAICDGVCGRWRSCHERCDQSESMFRTSCIGVNWEVDTLHKFATWSLACRGEMNELNRRLPIYFSEARERGSLYAETNLSTFAITIARLAGDEPLRAREELRESMSRWSQQGFHMQHVTRAYDEALIDIYNGDGRSALEQIRRNWPAFVRSQLIRLRQLRIFLTNARARSALCAAAVSADPRDLLRCAERDAAKLARERDVWAHALALMIRAGISAFEGQLAAPADLLEQAIPRFDALDMSLHAAAARLRLAELVGGDRGSELHAAAMSWMAGQGIKNPSRMTALVAPGFPDPDRG